MIGRIPWLRPGLRGTALAAAVVTVISGSAGLALSARAASPARLSAFALPSVVPWQQAGPGWAVAEFSASSAPFVTPKVEGPTTLYLVSPQGHKYPFYTWPATLTGFPPFQLVAWSGDRQRVLVTGSGGPRHYPVEQISLVTGKVVGRFTLPTGVFPTDYTRPNGLNLLATRNTAVLRYNLAGVLEKVLGASFNPAIDSPDGTSVIIGTTTGLSQVSNLGGLIRRFRPPVPVFSCAPARWWNATTVLASCDARGKYGVPRLWLFPIGGGKVTALTAQRGNSGPDLGDVDAWKLTSGVYLQALGGCGTEFIARQYRDGSVHAVNIPGTPNVNNRIITGVGARLLVQAETGCGGSDSLLWFNPGTRSVSFVVNTPHTISGIQVAIPYGRPLA